MLSYERFFHALYVNDIEMLGAAFVAMAELRGRDAGEVSKKLRQTTSGQKVAKISKYLFNASATRAACEWLNLVKKGLRGETWPLTVRDLQRFWNKYGPDELLPSDLTTYENWGFAIRYDAVTPVIIDAGFSRNVANFYYK